MFLPFKICLTHSESIVWFLFSVDILLLEPFDPEIKLYVIV